MNGRNNPLHELTPLQRFAVQIALHRFTARYRCPCPDAHEWRADCEAVAVVAVLTADDANPTESSPLEISPEESACTLGVEVSLRQMWQQWDESERRHVLWLARQAENALKRFWRQEHRYYSHTEDLVVMDEEGEWVGQEVEDKESWEAFEAVVEKLGAAQLVGRLWEQLDDVERAILIGLRESKTQGEIAKALGTTQSAVAHRLQKIRKIALRILGLESR
jgi:DNA-directed RNA polymerase specialized sigma24 family protein